MIDMPWPDSIPGLGERSVGPCTSCVDCVAVPPYQETPTIGGRPLSMEPRLGTWAFYGTTPLCLHHALQRAHNPESEED
jgi:hypothetical protein